MCKFLHSVKASCQHNKQQHQMWTVYKPRKRIYFAIVNFCAESCQ